MHNRLLGNIGVYVNRNIDLQGSRITLYGNVDLSKTNSVDSEARGHTSGIAYNKWRGIIQI